MHALKKCGNTSLALLASLLVAPAPIFVRMPKSFILVCWVEDETLSVLPATAICPGKKVYIGAFSSSKWARKFYSGEVFGVCGECIAFALDV